MDATNTTAAAGPIRQKQRLKRVVRPSLDSHIARFCNRIDRVSVSQHETALLIFGAIPILIGEPTTL
jgi:hypothetical protein